MPTFTAADYYDRLGLDRGSDERLIRRQYRLLARLYHPDVNPTEAAQHRFLSLREAYDVLADEGQRAEYNRWLQSQAQALKPLRLDLQLYPRSLMRSLGTQRVYALLDLNVDSQVEVTSTPLNVVLVLDRSSSMKGLRLHYVKEAARRIIANLSARDTFGIVTFNDRAKVVLPTGAGTDPNVALGAIDSISATGGTEIASGLRSGIQEVLRNHTDQVLSHIIMLTDGRTYGDEPIALDMAEKAGEMHISITALGLGTDWNDAFLDDLARRASGNAHFIAQPSDAVMVFQAQMQQLQRTFARDARIEVETPPGVKLLQAHEVAPGLLHIPAVDGNIGVGGLPAQPPLRLMLEFSVEIPTLDVALLGTIGLKARLVEDGIHHRTERIAILSVEDEMQEPPPDDIYKAAQRVATLRLQERAWDQADHGKITQASLSLEQLADRFLEIGATDLAQAAQREMQNVRQTGQLSEDGRKIIKYGTRMLALPAPKE